MAESRVRIVITVEEERAHLLKMTARSLVVSSHPRLAITLDVARGVTGAESAFREGWSSRSGLERKLRMHVRHRNHRRPLEDQAAAVGSAPDPYTLTLPAGALLHPEFIPCALSYLRGPISSQAVAASHVVTGDISCPCIVDLSERCSGIYQIAREAILFHTRPDFVVLESAQTVAELVVARNREPIRALADEGFMIYLPGYERRGRPVGVEELRPRARLVADLLCWNGVARNRRALARGARGSIVEAKLP